MSRSVVFMAASYSGRAIFRDARNRYVDPPSLSSARRDHALACFFATADACAAAAEGCATCVPGVGSYENSDVLPAESVAVAAKYRNPEGTPETVAVKLASPAASVVTVVDPRYCWPSPKVVVSQIWLAKKSMTKVDDGVLFSV